MMISELMLAFAREKNNGNLPFTLPEWREFIKFCGDVVPQDAVYGLCVLMKWILDIPLEREEILAILDKQVGDRIRLTGAADPLMN